MLTQLEFALSQLLSLTHLSLVELQKLLRTPQRKFETPQNSLHFFSMKTSLKNLEGKGKKKRNNPIGPLAQWSAQTYCVLSSQSINGDVRSSYTIWSR